MSTEERIRVEGYKNFQEAKEALNNNRLAWELLGIKDYMFVCSMDAMVPKSEPNFIKMLVEEGKEPVLLDARWYDHHIENPNLLIINTISKIFDYVEGELIFVESIFDGTYDGYLGPWDKDLISIKVRVKYHPEYHFPVEYFWEHVNSSGLSNEQLLVTEFVSLKEGGE